MKEILVVAVPWCQAVLLAALPWIAAWRPSWAPVMVVAALAAPRSYPQERRARLVASLATLVVAWASILILGAPRVAVGWLLLAGVVVLVGWIGRQRWQRRPDAADLVAMAGWGAAFLVDPTLVEGGRGGWLAPAVVLWAASRIGRGLTPDGEGQPVVAPPSREVRGTVSLRGVVVPDRRGLPLTVPLDLELRAGDTVAVLCDDASHAAALGEVLSGRRAPLAGEISVDGVPLASDDRLVAVVARGEPFVAGDLERNVAALCAEPLSPSTLAAVRESCALDEVEGDRAGVDLGPDGRPLSDYHRLLLLAARVLPSAYRVLVVVDPVPWVNAVRAELWRATVVRASLGRTAVWVTSDRDLALRAGSILELGAGTLRPANRRTGSQAGETT